MNNRNKTKPRVALLGEFSAGKSTLTNLLLGHSHSPVKVTATQMPPIWYRAGEGAPTRLLEDDSQEVWPIGDDTTGTMDGTKAVIVPSDAPILDRFDLLDMPGSSDPNMSPDIWDALLPTADIVIWCTPATQAWRQSEAAIWDAVPERLQQRSLLLLTRFDKIGVADRSRVLRRVRRETEVQFRHVLPAALLSARGPLAECKTSGLAAVMAALDDLLENPAPATPEPTPDIDQSTGAPQTPSVTLPRRVTTLAGSSARGGPRRRPSANSALI